MSSFALSGCLLDNTPVQKAPSKPAESVPQDAAERFHDRSDEEDHSRR